LARKYGIVTPYTAYLIMEDERRRDVPTTMRSLQGFEADAGARREAGRAWQEFQTQTAGDSAVADAKLGLALKSANAPAAAAEGSSMAFMRRYGLAPGNGSRAVSNPPNDGGARLVQYAQQSKFVGGKTFFLNDKQWIDSAVQKSANGKRVRVQFGSQEYFDLVANHPQAAPWLSLGTNVQFVMDKAIYEIYE
jgi:Ca-activated chloride channel family protein